MDHYMSWNIAKSMVSGVESSDFRDLISWKNYGLIGPVRYIGCQIMEFTRWSQCETPNIGFWDPFTGVSWHGLDPFVMPL